MLEDMDTLGEDIEEPDEDEDEDDTAVEALDDESEESLDVLMAKRKSKEDADDDGSAEESVLELTRNDRVTGSLPSNAKPQQSSEFTCRSCYLVKHQSQLANKKRMLCRDCA